MGRETAFPASFYSVTTADPIVRDDRKICKTELEQGGEIGFCRQWLSAKEADALFHRLLHDIPWSKSELLLRGEPVKTPRFQAWMGDPHVRADVYSATRIDWMPELQDLRKRLEKVCFDDRNNNSDNDCHDDNDNHGLRKHFDYVLLNLYQDGSNYIGYHADREVRQDDDLIASVSLGASRRFLIRPMQVGSPDTKDTKDTRDIREWTLRNGDLMTMNGRMQQHYKHSVPKTAKKVGPRINLTFRQS